MAVEKPLTEQEKRYLNALKLFMERGGDLQSLESAKILDQLSPEQGRAMIALYHTWLEDPQMFFLGYKLFTFISPILTGWAQIKDIFSFKRKNLMRSGKLKPDIPRVSA